MKVQFIGNYNNTGFPDNYFDAVISLESISYAKDKKDFVQEMYRILKPGGRLVIIDGFFINIKLSFFIKKIFKMWCEGRAVPTDSDHSLENLLLQLKKGRFKEINVMNLSKNVSRSALRSFFIGIPFFISSMFKRVIKFRKYKPVEDVNYFLGISVFTPFLGLSGGFKYFAVTAVKS
jgi:ubiquinone/menaquinone biosynthesis C-methylase UbiE